MAYIKELDPQQNPKLRKIYEAAEKRTGEPTANVLKVHSLNPEILEAHMQLYETIMFKDGRLSRKEREMIGVVVSAANECPYCVTHHAQSLFAVTSDKTLMRQVAADYTTAALSEKEQALCAYAEKLTKTAYKITETDIETLRGFGLDDAAILEANQITAYFNYVNRVVHGLGVELETI